MALIKRERMKKLGTVSSSPYTGSPTYTTAPVHIEAGYDPPLEPLFSSIGTRTARFSTTDGLFRPLRRTQKPTRGGSNAG